jgi:hypothetical protein
LRPNIQPIYQPESQVAAVCEELTQLVMTRQDQPLNQLTQLCDKRFQLKPGKSLAAVCYLLATRQWNIDMTIPVNPDLPLMVQSVSLKTAENEESRETQETNTTF